ncbi:MAG: glycosyltransferase family 2 protein [Chloroflexi bacterium]|nr:glycosyltransferase family 2 protein [Chloroflexota bacterium]
MISCVLVALDEEKNIAACLATLGWADEVVVLDGGSRDRTVALAQEAGARVESHPFDNFAQQKNRALDLARGEWIFLIDADERVPPGLAAEIKAATFSSDLAGFWMPRKNYIFGKWIKHAGWYPDYQMRLTQKGQAHYDENRQVHEVVVLESAAGYLTTPLIHHNYETVGQFMAKQRKYTEMAAQDLWREGRRSKPWSPLLQGWREFWRRYVTLEGLREGWRGLLVSFLMGYYEGKKYWRLWEVERRRK